MTEHGMISHNIMTQHNKWQHGKNYCDITWGLSQHSLSNVRVHPGQVSSAYYGAAVYRHKQTIEAVSVAYFEWSNYVAKDDVKVVGVME